MVFACVSVYCVAIIDAYGIHVLQLNRYRISALVDTCWGPNLRYCMESSEYENGIINRNNSMLFCFLNCMLIKHAHKSLRLTLLVTLKVDAWVWFSLSTRSSIPSDRAMWKDAQLLLDWNNLRRRSRVSCIQKGGTRTKSAQKLLFKWWYEFECPTQCQWGSRRHLLLGLNPPEGRRWMTLAVWLTD